MCRLEPPSSESPGMLVIHADSQSRPRLSESNPLKWGSGNSVKVKTVIILTGWILNPFKLENLCSWVLRLYHSNINPRTQCLTPSKCSRDICLLNFEKAFTEHVLLQYVCKPELVNGAHFAPLTYIIVSEMLCFCFHWFPMVSGS